MDASFDFNIVSTTVCAVMLMPFTYLSCGVLKLKILTQLDMANLRRWWCKVLMENLGIEGYDTNYFSIMFNLYLFLPM